MRLWIREKTFLCLPVRFFGFFWFFGLYQFICIIECLKTLYKKKKLFPLLSFVKKMVDMTNTFHTFHVVFIDENLSVLISFICHVWQFPFLLFFMLIKFLLYLLPSLFSYVKRFIGEKCIKSIFINKLYYTDTQAEHCITSRTAEKKI